MEQLSATERRIASLKELLTVVAAIRSLAALRVQEGRKALEGVHQYVATVDRALAAAVALLPATNEPSPPAQEPTAVIVLGSEHGFVGALNDQLLEAALRHTGGHRNSRLLMVGSRSAGVALGAGASIAWTQAMATRASGVVEVARRAADEVHRSIGSGEFERVMLVYASGQIGGRWTVQSTRLLPFDPAPYRLGDGAATAPLHYLPPERLIDKLVEELLFAELMRAAVESFASEHAARLATMESAHHAIEEKLQLLTRDAHIQRQEKITMELLDVVAGAEAVGDDVEASL